MFKGVDSQVANADMKVDIAAIIRTVKLGGLKYAKDSKIGELLVHTIIVSVKTINVINQSQK